MDANADPSVAPRQGIDAIGVLAEPNRRALYEFVAHQSGWVSREQAADAVGLQRGIAAHHLDRLAEEGLLEVDYQRLTGRSGPGAGRPAKVYRRASGEIGVTLPPRDYELAGRLLAEAAEQSRREGVPIDTALELAARDQGRAIGARARQHVGGRAGTTARRKHLLEALRDQGFEPEVLDDEITVLHNCPFHQLAQRHTELICGMNLCVLDSLLAELDGTGLRAVLEPEDGYCCVRFRPEAL
jgi:predicted ArsR family transcriptional regulator